MEMPRDWTERHIKELIEKYGGGSGSDGSVNGIPIFSKIQSVQLSEIGPPRDPYSQYPNIDKIDNIGRAGKWKELVSQYLVGYNIPVYAGDDIDGFEFKGYQSGSTGMGDLHDNYDYDYETILGGNDEVTVSLTAMGLNNSYSYIMIDQAPLIIFPVPLSEQSRGFAGQGAEFMPTLLRDIGFFLEIDPPEGMSALWTGMYKWSYADTDTTLTHRLYLITTSAGLPISTESANYYKLNPDFKYRNDGGDEVAISDLDVGSFGVVCIDFEKLESRFEYPHFMIGISFYDKRERATIMNVYEGDVYTMTFKDVLIQRR